MSAPETFDAIVIGTGQGGKPLAGALAEEGWSVAVVEKDRVGGTCVLRGCTPTKTMIASARIAHLVRRAPEYGVLAGGAGGSDGSGDGAGDAPGDRSADGPADVHVDLATVMERKNDVVEAWASGSLKGLERHDTVELIRGTARFTGEREVTVALNDGGERSLVSDKVFVNVGARPRIPDIPGLDQAGHLDSTAILELDEIPEHLVVLGGGFIGLEFGQMFRRFGAEVTVVERNDRLAPHEDDDVSEAIREFFEEEGVRVVTGAVARRVWRDEEGRVVVELDRADGAGAQEGEAAGTESSGAEADGSDGSGSERTDSVPATLRGSHLLVAAGRTPNTDLLDPGATGLETDERGYLRVNGRRESDVEGIWILGDVTGGAPFTHTAYDDYRIIAENVLEGGDATAEDRLLPYVVFTDPQLGRVGLDERQADERGLDYRVARLPMSRVARAVETDETRGFMKALVEDGTDRILGATVLGIEGGEVVSVLQVAMMGDLPYTALRDAMLAHPTLAESLNNLFMTLE